MNILILVFILFIFLVIFLRIYEIFKERQAKEIKEEKLEIAEITEPTTTETEIAEETPVNSKRSLLLPMFRRDSPEEFWGLLILIAAFSAGFIYLRYFR